MKNATRIRLVENGKYIFLIKMDEMLLIVEKPVQLLISNQAKICSNWKYSRKSLCIIFVKLCTYIFLIIICDKFLI